MTQFIGTSVSYLQQRLDLRPLLRIYQVNKTADQNAIITTSPVPILFEWTEAMDDFTEDDIFVRWFDDLDREGSLHTFVGADGRRTYTALLDIPASIGEVDIRVYSTVAHASETELYGPPGTVVKTIHYYRPDFDAPTVDIVFPDAVKCVTEVPVEFHWSEDVTGFAVGDVVATSAGSFLVFSNFQQVSASMYTAILGLPPGVSGTVAITVRARAAMGQNIQGPENDHTETFPFDTYDTINVTIEDTTTLCEAVYAFGDNPIFTGAFNNVLELLVHDGYAYFIVQIVRDRGSSPNNFLAWTLTGASALMRVSLAGDSDCELIHRWDDVLAGGRSLCVFNNRVHVFVGSHYLYQFENANRSVRTFDGTIDRETLPKNWRESVGEIWRVEAGASVSLEFVGKTGRTGQMQHISTTEEEYDPHYGIRGGTVSPMVAAGGELYYVAGWGDTRDIDKYSANSVVDDIRNWQFGKVTETLSERLPVLLTNNRTGWDVLEEMAILTHSRIGWRGTQLRFEGIAPRSAKLTSAITEIATTIPIDAYSHPYTSYPGTGIVSIQAELIKFSALGTGGLTISHRGAFQTPADGHPEDQTVLWIDHVIEEYLSLSISNDPSQIQNVIKIAYGSESEFEVIDENSVEFFGRRELSLNLPLSDEQTVWAEHIANNYLSLLKNPQTLVSLSVPVNVTIEIGQTVFVRQVERGHLYGAGQVVEITHDLIQSQTTALKLKML